MDSHETYNALNLPPSRKRVCGGCQTFVDSSDTHTWELIQGWQRARRLKKGGGNHIGLVKHLDKFLCDSCYSKLKDGISLDQLSLFPND